MNFASVEKVAAAILYEGYILYPYRPSAIKNRQRWNFGTLYPRVYAEARRPQEPFRLVAECLVVENGQAALDIKVSFLQLVPQAKVNPEDIHNLSDPSLDWDEAVERTAEFSGVSVGELVAAPKILDVRPAAELRAGLSLRAELLASGAYRLHLDLENVSAVASGAEARRDQALPLSLVSTHLVLGVADGEFVSLLEPAERYSADAKGCVNTGVFPVLAGEAPDRSMMLVSPIIMYDYPQTAPESKGDFFDGTEMDEMLTLRVLTLTDAEKEEMRMGDPRARRILERTEALTGEQMMEAHGVIRQLRELRPGGLEETR